MAINALSLYFIKLMTDIAIAVQQLAISIPALPIIFGKKSNWRSPLAGAETVMLIKLTNVLTNGILLDPKLNKLEPFLLLALQIYRY